MLRSAALARLTLETQSAHAAVDEALLAQLEFPTAAAYRRFLCMLFGFQAPLEAALAMTPQIDLGFLDARSKAGYIANDLLALGLTRNDFQLLAHRQSIPAFANVAQALGWMYATERLMLHVEALRIRLSAEMPVVLTLAHQFISVYENIGEIRWRQYGIALDRCTRTHSIEDIVAGARASMASLQQWVAMGAHGAKTINTMVEERASA